MLRTSCEGGLCVGTLLPSLAHNYPNQKVQIRLHAARAPTIHFRRTLTVLC